MTRWRAVAWAAWVVAAGLSAGCEEVKDKADRLIREERFKTVEDVGEKARIKADEVREKLTGAEPEGSEMEDPADAKLRNEAKGKPVEENPKGKPVEEDVTQ